MDFTEAEEKFRELQARIQRGEPLTEEQYQEEMQKLMVQDQQGTFWSLEPGTAQWLYFNGTEWVPGTPPHLTATPTAAAPAETAATAEAAPAMSGPAEPEAVPTYVRAGEAPVPARETGGLAPRPVRDAGFAFGEENSPWLPLAIGAIVLLLCAVALFFGVRNAPFLGTAAARATGTPASVALPSPTLEEMPTDTVQAPPTTAPTATLSVVTATLLEKLRVRGGPGTNFPVLATLDAGTTVTPLGRNTDGSWLQIQLPGSTDLGWVKTEFLKVTGDTNTLPVVESAPNPAPTKKPTTSKPTPTETPAG